MEDYKQEEDLNPIIPLVIPSITTSEPYIWPKEILINPYGIEPKYLKFLLKPLGERSNMAKLTGAVDPVACGYNFENKMFVIPFGGPALLEGELIPTTSNLYIKKIHYNDNTQYYIIEAERL